LKAGHTVGFMAVDDLPLPVVNFLDVIGVPWPYIDEDVVSDFATLTRNFGTAVRTTHDDATRTLTAIASVYQGASTDAMTSGWAKLSARPGTSTRSWTAVTSWPAPSTWPPNTSWRRRLKRSRC
jgi:hypothetical protein